MRICGIDASTKCTGMSLFENGILKEHHCIDLKKMKDADERLKRMIWEISHTIRDYNPSVVYIEDSWGKTDDNTGKMNIKTVKMLAVIMGAVYHECITNGRDYHTIYPSEWRKAVGIKEGAGIKREELKMAAVDRIYEKHGIKVEDDEAEGICIGEAGCIMEAGEELFE